MIRLIVSARGLSQKTPRIPLTVRHVNTLNNPSPATLPAHTRLLTVSYAKPILFGTTASCLFFITAAYEYDKHQHSLWDHWKKSKSWWNNRHNQPTFSEIWQEKRTLLLERRALLLERIGQRIQAMDLPRDIQRVYLVMAQKYLSLSEAQVTLACLVALNGVVFAAWQIPRLLPWMQRWFMHHPAHPRTITLLTSCFSHQGFLHLSMNMVGLWSFGTYLHDTLGREQFIALYLSMGIGANVISHCLSTALRSTRPMIPTLGASGAIYGLLSGMAYLHPQSSITMIFLPFLPVTLGHAMPALMALDVAGIIFKWRTLDHYAHLAGASFGLSYMAYGHHYVWQPLVQTMMEMRTC